jgi:hypothetical protein
MVCGDQNIVTLKGLLGMPLLGVLPYQEVADFEFLSGLLKVG